MKICIFTSAHLVNDIRVYKKELVSLLKHGYEVVYYTISHRTLYNILCTM